MPNPCGKCGSQLRHTTITHVEQRQNNLYIFRSVPVAVCDQMGCGETWYGDETLQKIDMLIATGRPIQTVETPIYEFAQAN